MINSKNPTLSSVMNAIISSVSKGRQTADFEAMKSAIMYQKIDLLKGLPVPRMRINNIKVSIPMILNNVTSLTEPDHIPITQISSNAEKSFKTELQASIEWIESGIKLLDFGSSEATIQLKHLERFRTIFNNINSPEADTFTNFKQDLEKRISFDLSVYKSTMNEMISEQGIRNSIGDSIENSLLLVIKREIFSWIKEKLANKDAVTLDIDRAQNSINELCSDKIIAGLIQKIRFAAETTCIELQEQSPELEILVDTESIKNAGGGPDSVSRLSFVLREEGLEWITEIDQDDKPNHKLSTE